MTTVSLQLKNADNEQIQLWVAYLKSLDFVATIYQHDIETVFLPIQSIKDLYPNQWVLLADTATQGVQIIGGRVILNAPDKRQLALQGRDLVKQYQQVRHFYTGELPTYKHIGLIKPIDKKTIL